MTIKIYASVPELKSRLGISSTDTDDDEKLSGVLNAISRAIDWRCNRRFYTTTADETRYFTAEYGDRLDPGDLLSITTLKTDDDEDGTYEVTWTEDTDYYLLPLNAALDEKPYTKIVVSPLTTDAAFPVDLLKGVQIVGTWGYWTSVPENIREATLLAAERLFKRKDAIFGITGSPELGMLRRIVTLDPDVQLLLDGMRKMVKRT